MMRTIHLWRIFVFVMIVVAMVNVLLIDYVWLKDREQVDQVSERINQLTTAFTSLGGVLKAQLDGSGNLIMPEGGDDEVRTDTCGSVCQRMIEQKVAQAIGTVTLPVTSSTPGANTTTNTTTIVSRAGTYYIPLSGIGSTKNLDWVNLTNTETTIDWSEYGDNRTVTWDIYAKIYQGNGKATVRLYDKTNAIAIPNSELQTGSENTVHLVSGELQMWSGNNTYVVQVKTNTGYEAYFESGRIKVVVK